jgi:hypothetical protein
MKSTSIKKKKTVKLGLGERYYSGSHLPSMQVEVPDSMFSETNVALQNLQDFLQRKYGWGIDEFVTDRLKYKSVAEMSKAFFAEQADAVAMAIYQIEEHGQSVIIADQTGIGKGRVNAGLIRYAKCVGKIPIVFTEKPNLFSDLFRDLIGIGSEDGLMCLEKAVGEGREVAIKYDKWEDLADYEKEEYNNLPDEYEMYKLENPTEIVYDLVKTPAKDYDLSKGKHIVPFIVNAADKKTQIMHQNGSILYKSPPKETQNEAINGCYLPSGYDFVLSTYTQVSSGLTVDTVKADDGTSFKVYNFSGKAKFLTELSKGNIVILDESHNASGGNSATGIVLQECVQNARGALFLSATFAKRPDNMTLYAMKTILQEANLTSAEMKESVEKGGLALQELLSASLVEAGQLLRRERGYAKSGAIVHWLLMDETITREMNDPNYEVFNLSEKHRKIADVFTEIMRNIIGFQKDFVVPYVDLRNEEFSKSQKAFILNRQTKDLGASNPMFFSKVFQIVSQMLLAIKVDAAADLAIMELKAGRKPIIALGNTMGSFIEDMTKLSGSNDIPADFSYVLLKGLHGSLRVQTQGAYGDADYDVISEKELGGMGEIVFQNIEEKIKAATTGIYISPIDYLKYKIRKAGYSIEEVTGRNSEVEYFNLPEPKKGLGKMKDDYLTMSGKVFCRVKRRIKPTPTAVFSGFNANRIDALIINQSGATGASAHAIEIPNVVMESAVKQRSMIVLQPELDINKETQKRGRIHRTGQIYPPIYYYLSSSIPAEKRLMMMLKSKLKSLDANTTSSSKQSGDIIKSEDFLNKYGDSVVYQEVFFDYQARGENSWYETLNLSAYIEPRNGSDNWEFTLRGEGGSEVIIKDLALKVSGRVALLPVIEQERFYSLIVEKYQAYVADKVATGDYDLEMETEDFQAELLTSPQPFVLGTGEGISTFSKSTMIAEYMVNNTQKPYTVDELRFLYERNKNQDLQGIKQLCLDLEEKSHQRYLKRVQDKLDNEYQTIDKWFEDLKNKTPQKIEERDAKKIVAKGQLSQSYEDEMQHNSDMNFALNYIFNTLKIGSVVSYDVGYGEDKKRVRAVFLGFQIPDYANTIQELTKQDIKGFFAINHSMKKVTVNIFGGEKYRSLYDIAISAERLTQYDNFSGIESMWKNVTLDAMTGRKRVSIITGNLLQAFGNPLVSGRLVQFTMKDGSNMKGIVLKDASKNTIKKQDFVKVRIDGCIPIVKSRTSYNGLNTNIKMTIFNQGNGFYKALVAQSKKMGGAYFTDKKLLKYVEKGNFESKSGKMEAVISEKNMAGFCKVLAENHNVSAMLTRTELTYLPADVWQDDTTKMELSNYKSKEMENISKNLYKKFQKSIKFAIQSLG